MNNTYHPYHLYTILYSIHHALDMWIESPLFKWND